MVTVSTLWIRVLFNEHNYTFLFNKFNSSITWSVNSSINIWIWNKIITFKNETFINICKILFATILMCFFLYFGLEYFEDKLKYSYKFKLIYLLIMVGLSLATYLLTANFLGILKLKSYKLKWLLIHKK